jgi:hypothetical protein
MNGGEALPQPGEGRQAVPYHRQATQKADRREDHERRVVHEPDEMRVLMNQRQADDRRDRQQTGDPEERPEDKAPAERRARRHGSASTR